MKRRQTLRTDSLLFSLVLGLCSMLSANAQDAVRGQQGAAPASPATARPAQPGTPNPITQAAAQKGVLACAGRIEQVSNFLGFSPQSGALLMAPSAQPDQRLVPLVMEVPAGDGGAYISASFAPNQANGCGATYDAVVYWPQSCDVVAPKSFAGLKNLGRLKGHIAVLDGGPNLKVFLMPAGAGCVSVKKEVVL